MKKAGTQLAALGGILFLLAVAAILLHPPTGYVDLDDSQKQIVVSLLGFAGLIYLAAIWVVCRNASSRASTYIVFGVAIVLRLLFVFGDPVLSSDIYRYVWDGQVQKAGINPYRYLPTDPALSKLRDNRVFPLINRANYAHTIYPPAAQVAFAAVGRVTGTVAGMKLAMVGFELLACVCMLKLLALLKLPPERLLIYAWNPLVLSSFASDGHVDAIAIGLLGVALLYRARHRPGIAGALLGGATLVKFLPVVVVPAFVRGASFWRLALGGMIAIVALYAIYSSVGKQVLGFLPGYGNEEGLTDGGGIWLLSSVAYLFNLSDFFSDYFDLSDGWASTYLICAAVAMALLGLWIALRRLKPGEIDAVILCRDTAVLAACTMVLISPHYPWYFGWLALPAVVAPLPGVIWLSVAPVILYLNPWNESIFWPAIIYLPTIGLAVFSLWKKPKLLPVTA